MLISDLQHQLRAVVSERIAAGEMTGTELARRAGFQQAHISNFLNERRGLSIETMDRVMEVMRLEVRDQSRDCRSGLGLLGFHPLQAPDDARHVALAMDHRDFTTSVRRGQVGTGGNMR